MKIIENITITPSMCNITMYGRIYPTIQFKDKLSTDNNVLYNIVVPDEINNIKVRIINDGAFSDCKYINSIILPDNIFNISKLAFKNCENLTSIKLPKKVSSIGKESFMNCSKLKSINFPNKLNSIGLSAFKNCTALNKAIINDDIWDIVYDAFENCHNLKIEYKKTNEEMAHFIIGKLPYLVEEFQKNNITIFATKEIDDFVNDYDNVTSNNLEMLNIKMEAQKEYFLNKIDDKINGTSDLNEKLNLLAIRDKINKYNICSRDNDIER